MMAIRATVALQAASSVAATSSRRFNPLAAHLRAPRPAARARSLTVRANSEPKVRVRRVRSRSLPAIAWSRASLSETSAEQDRFQEAVASSSVAPRSSPRGA
jgi:hypothetical protein